MVFHRLASWRQQFMLIASFFCTVKNVPVTLIHPKAEKLDIIFLLGKT